ncbi:hypothetical protein I0Q91_00380 [Halanaerobiaceae bacterium Z-7014]|uniref:Radical SAM protein n=1 Tax=Halonatronomonas betaini TaxID=2778430 RepID=A0A931F556_9FIRM|nr:hypothetical protein [Halonatronomonas betaini]MBF8435520.1 hypothetical protein [Halonatronomonas betaini]
MKISAYHKDIGDKVVFSKGKLSSDLKKLTYDRVYITTLFTFEWNKTIATIEYAKELINDIPKIFVGGIASTLMPGDIEAETGIKPILKRLDNCNEEAKRRIGYDSKHIIDNYTPDYDILSQIEYDYSYSDSYFAFMTRGCGMHCEFCAVDTLEPEYNPYISIKEQIRDIDDKYGEKKDLLLMDNNVLVSPYFKEIIKEIKELGYYKGNDKGIVDFNQGLDANILAKNENKAKLLGEIEIKPARIAFDHIEDKEVYFQAINNCIKYDIRYFSNYMLYNADSFEGKGQKYKADAPEDLYNRIKYTLEFQEEYNKNKCEEEKIQIYSFPMKYIPLESKDRNYISEPNWNKKYLRSIQVMLLPMQGVGGVSETFFRKAFGENVGQFLMNIKMPESILMKRGKFLRRDNEDEIKWNERINSDPEAINAKKYYDKWIDLYNKIKKKDLEDELIKVIGSNSFRYNSFFNIASDLTKKIYLFYLSNNQILLLLNKLRNMNKDNDINIVLDVINDDSINLYNDILNYIYYNNGSWKKLKGIFSIYGNQFVKDIIKIWVNDDLENDIILDKIKEAAFFLDKKIININKLKGLKRYIDSGCLNQNEVKNAKNFILDLNEDNITRILEDNFEKFKNQLKKNNEFEVCYDEIEKKIDVITASLNEQMSLF